MNSCKIEERRVRVLSGEVEIDRTLDIKKCLNGGENPAAEVGEPPIL